MADCTFCQIVSHDLDAQIVHEEERGTVFLDHRPLFPGHCLVVPNRHHETLTDLPSDSIEPLFSLVQRMAHVVRDAMGAQGTFVAMNNIVSQSVPHLHVHVVPRKKKDGLRGFFWPRYQYREGEMEDVCRKLVETLGRQG